MFFQDIAIIFKVGITIKPVPAGVACAADFFGHAMKIFVDNIYR